MRASNASLRTKHAPRNPAIDGKIMIVDDESINIKLAHKYLKLAGYQHIVGESDSRAVLGRILQEQPDIVLLDIMMPRSAVWRSWSESVRKGNGRICR